MRVIVIGCGLAGITTAYFLREQGADVTVIDRAAAPARETSFANGSLLTPSLADPWNSPGIFTTLVRSLGHEDASMLLRLGQLPQIWRWGLKFIANSSRSRYEATYLENVRFSIYSQQVLHDLLQQHPLQFEHAADGTVQIFESEKAYTDGIKVGHWLKQVNIAHRPLDLAELVELEPQLTPIQDRLFGGIHYPADEVGDARLFCEALHVVMQQMGVEFRFSEQVRRIEMKNRRVESLVTAREVLRADRYVLATGSDSPLLSRQIGFRLPIVPAKGYSLTLPVADPSQMPRYPIIDDSIHAAVVPLGHDRVRVAGTAEFAGYNTEVRPERIANLQGLLRKVYPDLPIEDRKLETWCGLRPMCADGRPIIGGSPLDNLFVNTGHGALGWTMACGSGKGLADLMTGEAPAYDLTPFSYSRF
ncbi:MAG: D-amino acid dehydrogenase [Gammaproteobacteria bacterium]|nr:D-amino acid dehydrogenase [Gammaproteobacteria bacterium]